MSAGRTIHDFTRLFRLRLSLFVALSAAAGHAASAYRLSWEIFFPSLACVLLAAGCSALNQYQERLIDDKMIRTMNRPLPTGGISPANALVLAAGLVAMALVLLWFLCGGAAAVLGLTAVILYNGFYTWLKRVTAFAAVPGAIIGALGPAIGWVAGGGSLTSPTLLAIGTIFMLWQVPHFWLLSLRYPSDYANVGYPSAVKALGGEGLYRVGLIWIACTGVATLSLPLFGLLKSGGLYIALCATAAILLGVLVRTARRPNIDGVRYRTSFVGINWFVLVTMILLIVESGL